jgi:hypothetical protein
MKGSHDNMYEFAVVALLALAILKVTDFLSDLVPLLERFRSIIALVLALVVVVGLDYSLFSGWGIDIRDAAYGPWITAFVVWGLTVPWRAIFGYLTHDRANGDESLGAHVSPFTKAA